MSKYNKDKKIANIAKNKKQTRVIRINLGMLVSIICVLFSLFICLATNKVMIQALKQLNLTGSDTYTITIEYLTKDGNTIYSSYEATLPAGTTFAESVTSPTYIGYAPYTINDDGEYEDATIVYLDIEDLQEDITIEVYYLPQETTYMVKRYTSNIYDDNYSLYSTEVLTGTVDTEIQAEDVEKEIEGFTLLLYDTVTIAADGSTVLNLYYEREYYLITFDMQGGYGVDPIYAKYGSTVTVTQTPTKTGYTFIGWDLDGDGEEDEIVSTMPAENLTYTALYTANSDCSFTIAYWLEDPDGEGARTYGENTYNYWGAETVENVTAGSVIDVSSYYDIPTEEEWTYYQYATYYTTDCVTTGDDVTTVGGAGNTTVNLYYTRSEYTLRFFYAKETNGSYYVVGGSTYGFGTSGTSDDDTLQDLLENVASSEWGEVEELPEVSSDEYDKYTYGSETYNNVTYYYLSFSAKYGQNIMDIWPAYVLEPVKISSTHSQTSLTYAYFSAWNGERKVYYSQHNSNQTIKGKYEILDYTVLYDLSSYEDSDVVNYLAFWENGVSGITWSIPIEWTYNIYVSETGESDSYELKYSYVVYDNNSTVSSQTAPSLSGYSLVSSEGVANGTVTYEENETMYAYIANFYYVADQYELYFYNGNSIDKTYSDVSYGSSLEEYYYEPDLPNGYEEDAYEFGGWYTSPECLDGTEWDFENDTMPANDLILYAKWTKIIHTVTLYYTYSDYVAQTDPYATIEIEHGEVYGDSYTITRDGYDYMGWYYIDDDGNKVIFSLTSMQITEDISLYAEWYSVPLIGFEISYVYIDSDGNEIEIADKTTGSWYDGSTRVFKPKTGTDLYEGYQTNYFPEVSSHCLLIEYDDNGECKYTFYYIYAESMTYTVYYRDYTTGEDISTDLFIDEDNKSNPKVVTTTQSIVTEVFTPIQGYVPTTYQQTLIITADATENVLIFYYIEDDENGIYYVSHYIETLDGNWEEVITEQGYTTLGSEITRSPQNFDTYTYNEELSTASGTVTVYGLHLELYYNLNEYEYTVQYLEYGTNEELAETKTSTAKYTATVTEEAIDISGYELISDSTKSILITAPITDDDGNEVNYNTITFYYVEVESASITITKVAQDDIETTLEGVEFSLFTLICTDETHDHDADDDLIDVDNYDTSCWELFGTYTTDELGEMDLENLLVDDVYRLVETKTVEDYLIPEGQWKIELGNDLLYDSSAVLYNKTYLKITAIGNPPALSLLDSEDGDILYLYNSKSYDLPTSGGEGIKYIAEIGIPIAILGMATVYAKEKMLAGVVVHRSIRRSRRR